MRGIIAALLIVLSAHTFASIDVYEFAKNAANAADSNLKRNPPNDGATLSARAYQDGKAVVYEYVIAFRRDIPDSTLSAWRAGTRSEVIPSACSAIRATPAFKQGFHFRYRYLNREGLVMDDFLVNKPACEGL